MCMTPTLHSVQCTMCLTPTSHNLLQMPRNTFYNNVVETDVEWLYTNPSPVPLTADREFVVKPNTQCNLLGMGERER